MFYAQFVLSKKGPLAKIWLAAHWEKKLSKAQVYETNVENAVDEILKPKVRMALRTTGHLLLGIVRIYSRKAKYLLADCNEAFLKIKMAFRPGQVDLPEDGREAHHHAITLPDVFHDFDSALPDFAELELSQSMALNQSRVDEITLKDDLPMRHSHNAAAPHFGMQFGMDDFGDAGGGGLETPGGGVETARDGTAGASLLTSPQHEGRLSAALQLDAPIPDDFGGQLDEGLFMEDIFTDEALRAAEEHMENDAMPTECGDKLADETLVAPVNLDDSFALQPLDTTLLGLERAARGGLGARRKRRLLLDETRGLSGEEMKEQMAHYDDTLIDELDLAPPTKRVMHARESGTVDRLFAQPSSQALRNPRLRRLIAANQQEAFLRADDDGEGDETADGTQRLSVVEEMELPRQIDLDDDRLSLIHCPPIDASLREDFDGAVSPMEPLDVDLADDAAPAALLSPKSAKKERKSRATADRSQTADETDDTLGDGAEGEERRWTKRTQAVLNNLRSRLHDKHSVTFTEITDARSTRKSAANKFYTLLVLKKWQAIDVQQKEPFAEISVSAGPQLDSSNVAA